MSGRKRSSTMGLKALARALRVERALGVVDLELVQLRRELEVNRPRTRADCEGLARPCPYFSCRWNLYLDALPTGSIKFNFPDREFWEIEDTCALDVAERGGITLEDVAKAMNLTRERVRQIEERASLKIYRWLGGSPPDRGTG